MFPAIERLFQLKSGVWGKCSWMPETPFLVAGQAGTGISTVTAQVATSWELVYFSFNLDIDTLPHLMD
jgi:hypothetical protein